MRSQFGSTPQIDLDLQIARVRVLAPMALDFAALVDGVRRMNVGVAGITLQATARVEDEPGGEGRTSSTVVVIEPGGQRFPLEGPPPPDRSASWRSLRVHGFETPGGATLEVISGR